MKEKDFKKLHEQQGFKLDRQNGSHRMYKHEEYEGTLTQGFDKTKHINVYLRNIKRFFRTAKRRELQLA